MIIIGKALFGYCLVALVLYANEVCAQDPASPVSARMVYPEPDQIKVGGILGQAISASRQGRLQSLPFWNDGELVKMFSAEIRDNHHKTDWYGEHGGKWLYTASIAARQSGDPDLKSLLLKTADFLVSTQEENGYLGVYSPKIRITSTEASHNRSWDSWNLSYMALGLLKVNEHFPNEKYLNAANGIGELLLKTFGDGKNDITDYGTRHGVSATIILDPVVELYKVTGDRRYLNFADLIIQRMEANPGVKLIKVATNGGDMELVGDGKAYQLLWNLTAIVKLFEVTGNSEYLKALQNAWQNISEHHLTIAGGPWGGVGKHKECFNSKNYWSPYGFIETCSTMSWIQLNKELLRVTGEPKYAEEIEKSAYNALTGAQYPNGEDWCYHSFSNGSRHIAHFNDCCPSSGALALEEVATLIYGRRENGIAINLFTESEGEIQLTKSNTVRISQQTAYPVDGAIRIVLHPSRRETFPVFIRIPNWSPSATISVNGKNVPTSNVRAGEFFKLEQSWRDKDVVQISFPMKLKVHQRAESAGVPQGGGDIYRVTWFALTRGPLVFAANGLIDGKDRERTFNLGDQDPEKYFTPVASSDESGIPAFELRTPGHQPVLFVPYFEAGGRREGTWRLTWIQNTVR